MTLRDLLVDATSNAHQFDNFEQEIERFYGKLTFMQSSGLRDKDNVEIYEGDILKHDLWGPTVVIWDSEGACFRGNSEERDMTLAHHQLQRSKIIGNIYETPNLSKDQNA